MMKNKLLILITLLVLSINVFSQNIFENETYKTDKGNIIVKDDKVYFDLDGYKLQFEIFEWSKSTNIPSGNSIEIYESLEGDVLMISSNNKNIRKITISSNGVMYVYIYK